MKKTCLLILTLILSACNNVKDKNNASSSLDSSNQIKNSKWDSIAKNNLKHHVRAIDSALLLGIWARIGEDNAEFDIRKSTVFFPDNNKIYNYKIIADSIKMFYEDFNESFGYRFSGSDTLILMGEDGTFKYYRVKK